MILFAYMVQFNDEELNVTYTVFDCGVIFLLEALTKVEHINLEKNLIPCHVKTPCLCQITFIESILLIESMSNFEIQRSTMIIKTCY